MLNINKAWSFSCICSFVSSMDSICPFFLSLDYYTRLTLAFSKAKLSLNDEGAICRALEPKIQRGVRDLFWERRPQFPPSAFKYVTLGGVGAWFRAGGALGGCASGGAKPAREGQGQPRSCPVQPSYNAVQPNSLDPIVIVRDFRWHVPLLQEIT